MYKDGKKQGEPAAEHPPEYPLASAKAIPIVSAPASEMKAAIKEFDRKYKIK